MTHTADVGMRFTIRRAIHRNLRTDTETGTEPQIPSVPARRISSIFEATPNLA